GESAIVARSRMPWEARPPTVAEPGHGECAHAPATDPDCLEPRRCQPPWLRRRALLWRAGRPWIHPRAGRRAGRPLVTAARRPAVLKTGCQRRPVPPREPLRFAFFNRLSYWCDIRWAWIWEMKSITTTTVISSRSEEHTSELQSRENLVCRLLLE